MPFEMIEHTGDLAVRLRAADLGGLVAEGVRALGSILFEGEPAADAPRERRELCADGIDREDALVQGLSEALHALQEGDLVPLGVCCRGGPERLEIALEGVRADGARVRRVEEIKAVTYHALEIRESSEGGLEAVVVLDV